MATDYTVRLIIAVRAAFQQQANEIAQVADPTTDAQTFTVPYRLVGGTAPVAYIANWLMTPEHRDNLRAEYGRRAGRAIDVIRLGEPVDRTASFLLFHEEWGLDGALDALGLERMPSEE